MVDRSCNYSINAKYFWWTVDFTGFTTILGFRLCCKEIFSFLAGYYLKKRKDNASESFCTLRTESLVYLLYPISVILWDRTHFVIFYNELSLLSQNNIALRIFILAFEVLYFYVVSFWGIAFLGN